MASTGMNIHTGKALVGNEHLKQSIRDILSTAVGLRVMLLDYGSGLPDLVDRPMNALFNVELFAATAQALKRWEPRFVLTGVSLNSRQLNGQVTLTVQGYSQLDNEQITLEGVAI